MVPSEGFPNFDIRIVKNESRDYLARVAVAPRAGDLAEARIAGVARLQSDGKTVDLIADAFGAIEVVSSRPGSGLLTEPAADPVAAMREFMTTYADMYGLSPQQAASLELVAAYTNPAGNMSWVEFEQRVNGLPVFQGLIRGGFTAAGALARTTGPLAPGLVPAVLPVTPSLSPAAAVERAVQGVGWQQADEAHTELVYFPLAPGVARLAWSLQIVGEPFAYLVVVDAADGTLLFRKNLTSFQTQPATYVVYTDDSPAPLSPTTAVPGSNTQAPYISRTPITLIGNEPPNTFNNLGWMTDGTNGINGHTDGNNVEAGVDLVAPDGVDAPVAGTNRAFDFVYDPEVQEPSTPGYRSGEVTQLFYWTNVFHDRAYLLGFTEAARNFQHDNFGRGGTGNDRIRAEAQNCDFPPSCFQNPINVARFLTPMDGFRGRLELYLFPGSTPDRSSGLDQEIVLHELTHGLSSRLHNNARGLVGNMPRGLAEGWSDFYARALLSTPDEDINGVFATAGWVTHLLSPSYTDNYYYGSRRFPRALRTTLGPNGKPHDPLTFADIDQTQMNLADGAYPAAASGSNFADQIHNMGEVWAGALLEVRARFIARLGFALGNQRSLQFVTDGMKLNPTNPTFLQARDAILAAANAGGGTPADIADIWAGFAARGMGVLAKVIDAGLFDIAIGTTRVLENFNVPGDPVPAFSINDVSVSEGNAGTTTATFTVTLSNPVSTQARVHIATADDTALSSVSFSNATAIAFPASIGSATPYPSSIVVPPGLGQIQAIGVELHSLSHQWPDDIDLLLVSPSGQSTLLMSDTGGFNPGIVDVDLTFRQGAPLLLAGVAPTSGLYGPTNFDIVDLFPDDFEPPAPGPPWVPNLNVFNGSNPTGTWSLFVVDDHFGEVGQIAGGWTLHITTAANDYVSKAEEVIFPPGVTSVPVSITVNGDTAAESNETFLVNLLEPLGATIADAQGVGTILNDESGPTTVGDAYSTPHNTPLIVAAPGVLANDIPNSGGVMTAALVTNGGSGVVALAADGGFTYTPRAGFSGIDSFTYRALTALGVGAAAPVALTVGSAVLPTTVNDAYSTTFSTTLNTSAPGVLANDISNGGSAMTAVLLDSVTNGVLTLAANGGFSYTPNAGFSGADVFTYRAVTNSGPGNLATVTITVGAAPTLQAPTALRVVSMVGNAVTLRWEAPMAGLPPTGYVLEGGLNPGQVLASINTASLYPVFTFTAPTGAFYVRVHALRSADRSAASNEARLFVNVPQAPSTPINLLGVVNGNSLGLTWVNTYEGGAPSSIVLDVAGAGSIVLPSQADRLEGASVPAGTYTVSARAMNATGSSASSNAVTLTIPGPCSGPPMAPAHFLAYKTGATLYLIWESPQSGPAPTGYVVNVTGSIAGNFPTTTRFVSAAVGPGTYTVSVTATNACGTATTGTQSLTIP